MNGHLDLLLMRFVLLNLGGVVLLLLATRFGLLAEAWHGDTTYISTAIGGVFLFSMALVSRRLIACARMLNGIKRGVALGRIEEFVSQPLEVAEKALLVKFSRNMKPIEYGGYLLVTLGFLGTVWGFKMAMSGIDASKVGNVDNIAPMVAALISGMSVALWTTIVGCAAYIWVGLNLRLLEGGYDRLYTAALEARHDLS